ncbi:YxeA family protein [Geomicrobium sp. JCM 19055]|uniref:YxeA family protein n=1 Tax=Geomicrobium sp. JCM 19055 TaxID=1460649 RepID=UPI0005AA4555|nr:YxeA family protein [Geomicrobium sp. JCM 19055]
MKKIIISCLVIIIAIVSLYFLFRDTFDRFNPLIEQEYVYVEIQSEPSDDNDRYKYREHGVTEAGETKQVVFSTSVNLDKGTFIRVLAKGAYTEEYELIEKNEMPINE